MSSSTSLFCFVLAIVVFGLVAPAIAEDDDSNTTCTSAVEYCWNCPSKTSINATTAYVANLGKLFASLPLTNQTNYGFYNSSLGTGTDKVNLMALCRGDLAINDCHACYAEASLILSQNCSSKHQAILWAEHCTVRYSNVSIFGIEEDEPAIRLISPNSAPNSQQFKLVLNPLMKNLTQKAASGDSMKKFAAGHAAVPAGSATNQTIYATTQCSPDLNKQDCSECLEDAVSDISKCCEGKDGARVLKPSCMLRFESNMFYEPSADTTASPPSSATAPPPSATATPPTTATAPPPSTTATPPTTATTPPPSTTATPPTTATTPPPSTTATPPTTATTPPPSTTATPPTTATTAPPPSTEGNNTSNATPKISPSASSFFKLLLSLVCVVSVLALF